MNGFHSNQSASTSSGQHTGHHHMRQKPTQNEGNMSMRAPPIPRRHVSQHNSWDQQMPMNPHTMARVNDGQFSAQQQWMNQSNQAYQNGMPSRVNNFNMPSTPSNVLRDAIALSAPVESADEPVLVQQILHGLRRGETYKEILNSLHGKNGHSASLWKDYYLDHKSRLDSWVNMCLQKKKSIESASTNLKADDLTAPIKKPTIKKPSPTSFKVEHSPGPISLAPTNRPGKRSHSITSSRSTPTAALTQASGIGRVTINSLTAPAPVFDSRLPPPHADVKIPDPPSRSPTPPTRVIPQGRGNKYTPEDREFFIKFLQRQLEKDPGLNRNELCERIAEKAPHHTTQSWASHWSLNHDLPDKILAAARGREYAQAEADDALSEEERKQPIRKRPRYRDPSTSDDEAREDVTEDSSTSVGDEDDSESDDGKPVKRWKDSEMGEKGGPFTEADMYMAAKHIAEFPDWEESSWKDRWEPFANKYPQRSAKSWGEFFRRSEKDVQHLVKKLREEYLQSQRVRPARSTPRKRKVDREDESD